MHWQISMVTCTRAEVKKFQEREKRCITPCPEIAVQELQEQLRTMKKGKAADSHGLAAEFLRGAGEGMLKVIASMMTEIIRPNGNIPEHWREVLVRVLHKKGDTDDAANYRPICIIPILYKLFSKVLLARIERQLDCHQRTDQAGFRKDFSTDDHLYSMTALAELAWQGQTPLWIGVLDFKKAFDCIEHEPLWQALSEQGIQEGYIDALPRIYERQTGRVCTDATSKPFTIERGSKQGDPISPQLFNALTEKQMSKKLKEWEKKGFGFRIIETSGGERKLTNLKYADDIILTSKNRKEMKQMLDDAAEISKEVGLQLHTGKTKVITNGLGQGTTVEKLKINDQQNVEVLQPEMSVTYLGRELNFVDTNIEDEELQARVKKAWKVFHQLERVLTDRDMSLKQRLQVFDSVITAAMLYGCTAWAMTKEREQQIHTIQMKMMRAIIGKDGKAKSKTSMEETM